MAGLDVLLPAKPSMNLWLVEMSSSWKPEWVKLNWEGGMNERTLCLCTLWISVWRT